MSLAKVIRLSCAVALLAVLSVAGAPGTADASPCEPTMAHRVVYSASAYRVVYVIRLCTDDAQVFYGSEVQRQESGSGVIVNTDGLAPCRSRICHSTVGIGHPAPEIAGYRSNMFWFIGPVAPVDEAPWQICATAGGRAGCRSA